jgi:carbamoyl-phosphate synthase large subunit
MNYLFCSVGRRGELLKDFKKSIPNGSVLVAADNSPYAPALYLADKQYLVPRIDDASYIDVVLDICKKEKINAVTTFIDPEIELLSKNRARFAEIGVEVLAPYEETAALCFDKYEMFKFLKKEGIDTVMTWGTLADFDVDYKANKVAFPVFVKPRTGSGSVGARKVVDYEQLAEAMRLDSSLIIQEFMNCLDLDADVYIDTISHQAVAAFSKKKIETRIGGASKTISFKDPALFEFISKIVATLKFNGPVDMDFFYRDGKYYLSEVNPRFGGAYLHAYGAGVDFIKLIENNLHGIANKPSFGEYDEGVVMLMYDSVVIRKPGELAE